MLSFNISDNSFTWEENVLKEFWTLWLSPIPINILSKIENSLLLSACIWIPDWIAKVNNPILFKTIVYPPALGPVIIMPLQFLPISIFNGTALFING